MTRILVSLVLGLGTTVAIAWGSAARDRGVRSDFALRRLTPDEYQGDEYVALELRAGSRACVIWFPSWPVTGISGILEDVSLRADPRLCSARTALESFREAGLFPKWWGGTPRFPLDEAALPGFCCVQEACGWPLPALWSESTWIQARKPTTTEVRGGIRLAGGALAGQRYGRFWVAYPRTLPLRPVPLGMAADSALFAGAWFVVLVVPRAIRLRWRRRRGLCVGCGYSRAGIAGEAPCPECGESVR